MSGLAAFIFLMVCFGSVKDAVGDPTTNHGFLVHTTTTTTTLALHSDCTSLCTEQEQCSVAEHTCSSNITDWYRPAVVNQWYTCLIGELGSYYHNCVQCKQCQEKTCDVSFCPTKEMCKAGKEHCENMVVDGNRTTYSSAVDKWYSCHIQERCTMCQTCRDGTTYSPKMDAVHFFEGSSSSHPSDHSAHSLVTLSPRDLNHIAHSLDGTTLPKSQSLEREEQP